MCAEGLGRIRREAFKDFLRQMEAIDASQTCAAIAKRFSDVQANRLIQTRTSSLYTTFSYYVTIERASRAEMIEENIPAGIRQKIIGSSLWPGTRSIAQTLNEHYRLSGLPFFREYTDHSFQHSIDVFRSACDVVPESAFEIISSDDLNILLLAALFHDAGLHTTEDVFLALTDPSNSRIAVPEFDDKSWPELWADFLAEARRFNDKKLIALFGDTERVREPPLSALEMSQRDRLLIGDFLRKHHPRFAHELIIGAVPDAQGGLFRFPELEGTTKDIIGLVARSHGLSLRNTFDYIQSNHAL
jgi:hypothetical protein